MKKVMVKFDNYIGLLIDNDGRWDYRWVPSKMLVEGRVVSMFKHIKTTIENEFFSLTLYFYFS